MNMDIEEDVDKMEELDDGGDVKQMQGLALRDDDEKNDLNELKEMLKNDITMNHMEENGIDENNNNNSNIEIPVNQMENELTIDEFSALQSTNDQQEIAQTLKNRVPTRRPSLESIDPKNTTKNEELEEEKKKLEEMAKRKKLKKNRQANEKKGTKKFFRAIEQIRTARPDLFDKNDVEENELSATDSEEIEDELPTSILFSNIPETLFDDQSKKENFQRDLSIYEKEPPVFLFLKSFDRIRITYQEPESARSAQIDWNGKKLYGSTLHCFFQLPIFTRILANSSKFLLPPPPEKQFLISPPASPPMGWKQGLEEPPIINNDLIALLNNMKSKEPLEIEPTVPNVPKIVLHPCTDDIDSEDVSLSIDSSTAFIDNNEQQQ
ncbi:hypothetical protein SNEBB_004460 [Seison nebaliae]|nr:hypothetical protein SNEBB_004460 [Seison nebaliae]